MKTATRNGKIGQATPPSTVRTGWPTRRLTSRQITPPATAAGHSGRPAYDTTGYASRTAAATASTTSAAEDSRGGALGQAPSAGDSSASSARKIQISTK